MDTFDEPSEHSTVLLIKPNNKDIKLMNENNPEEQQLNPFTFGKVEDANQPEE